MSRYIDADALIEELQHCSYETWSKDINRAWWAQAVKVKDNIVNCIKRQPTADVVEVRHGKWIKVMNHKECSRCGNNAPYKKIKAGYHLQDLAKYCPNCGAKMDGERSENGKS